VDSRLSRATDAVTSFSIVCSIFLNSLEVNFMVGSLLRGELSGRVLGIFVSRNVEHGMVSNEVQHRTGEPCKQGKPLKCSDRPPSFLFLAPCGWASTTVI